MNSNTLRVLFLIAGNRINQTNKCAIKCRITSQKKRKEFSTGLFINSSLWNSKRQLVEPPEPDIEYINTQLSLIRQNLNQAFLFLKLIHPFRILPMHEFSKTIGCYYVL